MADKLSLEVVTPFRTVLNEDVDSVTLPGIEGEPVSYTHLTLPTKA